MQENTLQLLPTRRRYGGSICQAERSGNQIVVPKTLKVRVDTSSQVRYPASRIEYTRLTHSGNSLLGVSMLKEVYGRFRTTFVQIVLAIAIVGVLAGTPLIQPIQYGDCPSSTCDHG